MPTEPHHNPALERSLLSCCLYGVDEVLACTRDGLIAEAFWDSSNRKLWGALVLCAIEDRSTAIEVIWRRLAGLTGDGIPLSADQLARLYDLEPTTLRRQALLADVLGLWRQRRLVGALRAATEAASANAPHWLDVWEATEPHLRAAQQTADQSTEDTLASMADRAAQLIEHGDTRRTVATGIDLWDREAGCPRAGELIVIAARPGLGKTALALQISLRSTESAGTTAFFSLEMSGDELVARMAAHRAGRPGCFDSKLRAQEARRIGGIRNLTLLDGRHANTIAQIEARCRLMASHPAGIRMIVIDYLQLVAPPADLRRESRERQVAEMSRRFKLLALALDCPVLLLAQLNRESEKEQRRPRMSDLRESGAIEQDADRLWFLYQEAKDSDPQQSEDAAEIPVRLYQAKCRNGTPGIVASLRFMRPTFTFSK